MGALGRVNAPDAWMKSERAEMPFCEPRIVGRNSWWEAFWRRCLKASYRGQWQRMCSRVSVGSPHGQAYWPSRENPRLNSPVWLWPVRHCSVLPKSSRLAFRVRKWCQPRGLSCEAHHLLVANGFAPADALTAAEASQIGIRVQRQY